MSKNLPTRVEIDDGLGIVLLALAEPEELKRAQGWLEEAGYTVLGSSDPLHAHRLIQRRLDLDAVVAEHSFCVGQTSLLEAVLDSPKGLEIILAGPADVFLVTQAIAAGATSFLPHPMTQSDLLSQVLRAVQSGRQLRIEESFLLAHPAEVQFEGLVGTGPRMAEVIDRIRKAAPADVPVVILGESGTGKELVARAIHSSSSRADGPFVALHLLAMAPGVLESELFGHKKFAFTDAKTERIGKLQLADGGTLFLDELGDIPLEVQAKLLRVLESKSFEPVGSNESITSDFRLIAATNQDIQAMIKARTFRQELWQRLSVVKIELPALRERRGDLLLLVEHFAREAAQRHGKPVPTFDREALAALSRYSWEEGNIRELRNVIESLIVLAGPRVELRDIPREIRGGDEASDPPGSEGASLAGQSMDTIEREAIRQTLEMTGGNRKAAAELLQIGERTLYRKIEKYDL